MSLLANNSILQEVIGQKLNKLIAPQKPKGLLGFAKSQYAQDLGTGLLAQSGYQPMPTSLGQSIGTAFQNANQLENQRRMTDFSELGALTNIYGALNPTGSKTNNDWKLVQSYAKDRDIVLSEEQAKQIERFIGSGNVSKLSENTGTFVNTLDALLKPYQNQTIKNNDDKKDTISLDSGEAELKQENINKKVKDIGDDFATYGWSKSLNTVQEVADILSQEGNIEGIGPIEGKISSIFLGEKGKLNRAVFAKLFNITLLDRSGVAVTEPELDRLKDEFNAGGFKTDNDYRNAFNVFKRILNKTIKQGVASYDSKAFNQWVDNGGVFQVTGQSDLKKEYGF